MRDVHAHARETHDSPCGSIISQKSDNWFINALAASAIYRLITPFRTTEPGDDLCRLLRTPPVFHSQWNIFRELLKLGNSNHHYVLLYPENIVTLDKVF